MQLDAEYHLRIRINKLCLVCNAKYRHCEVNCNKCLNLPLVENSDIAFCPIT